MGWVMQSAPVTDLEKSSLAMLKEYGAHSKWISEHINSQTTEDKQAIIAAAKNANHHAAYAYSALLCDDIYTLDKDRLTAAIKYLEQLPAGEHDKDKGIENIIKTLKISLEYLNYAHASTNPEYMKKE